MPVLSLCSAVLSSRPQHAKALYLRAAAHQAREDWAEAEADWRRLLQLGDEAAERGADGAADGAVDQPTRAKVARQLRLIAERQRQAADRERTRLDGFLLRRGATLYDDKQAERQQAGALLQIHSVLTAAVAAAAPVYSACLQQLRWWGNAARSLCARRTRRQRD